MDLNHVEKEFAGLGVELTQKEVSAGWQTQVELRTTYDVSLRPPGIF